MPDQPSQGLARRLSNMALGARTPCTESSISSLSPPTERPTGLPNTSVCSHNGASSAGPPACPYSNEDSFSRTLLYGTPNQLRSTRLESHQFRLMIVQDKGELMQKNNYKTCFDSARDHHFDKLGSAKLNNRHDPQELIEFMFGNPIHQDLAVGDRYKIHELSKLKDLPHSMLFTLYFKCLKKVFAIGVVLPVSSTDFNEAILSNHTQITSHLTLIKDAFIENHVEKRNPAVSHNYLDVAILFKQLMFSINNLVTTPRLLLGLTQQSESMFNQWCYEVHNWIEIKDGARAGMSGTRFLQTLLTVVNSVKKQLVDAQESDEVVRVVIMAVNPIVAQKLIFILAGILPFKLKYDFEDSDVSQSKLTISSTFSDDDSTKAYDSTAISGQTLTPPTPSVISKGWEIPTTPSCSRATPSLMTPTRSSVVQPLSSSSQSMAYLSSSLQSQHSFSSSLSRGFNMLQNWKNSLDMNTSSSTSHNAQSQGSSPGVEYDEYPWNGYPNPQASTNSYTTATPSQSPSATQPIPFPSLPRSFSTYEISTSLDTTKSLKRNAGVGSMPKLPHIDRSTTTIFSIGQPVQGKNTPELACRSLLATSTLETTLEFDPVKSVNVLTVSLDELDDFATHSSSTSTSSTTSHELSTAQQDQTEQQHLPPLCGYINDFTPEFHLQACANTPDLESKIGSAMKSDLHNHSRSRTILVSLRAREIREYVVSKSLEGPSPPGGTACSSASGIRTRVKKLYAGFKPCSGVDKVMFSKIDQSMEWLLDGKDIKDLVKDW